MICMRIYKECLQVSNKENNLIKTGQSGISTAVQWLRLLALNAGSMGSILGERTKIPHTTWRKSCWKYRKGKS